MTKSTPRSKPVPVTAAAEHVAQAATGKTTAAQVVGVDVKEKKKHSMVQVRDSATPAWQCLHIIYQYDTVTAVLSDGLMYYDMHMIWTYCTCNDPFLITNSARSRAHWQALLVLRRPLSWLSWKIP